MPPLGPAAGIETDGRDGLPIFAKVVRLLESDEAVEETGFGREERWKDCGKKDSKNCSRSSSARMTMRKVGRVM